MQNYVYFKRKYAVLTISERFAINAIFRNYNNV